MLPSVGVVVFTLRGMQHIDRCVESVGWADTVQLCALDDNEPGCIAASLDHTDWVLYLFGEEQVDAELSAAIQDALRSPILHSAEPYGIRIRSRLLDRWLEASCWGPVPSQRLLQTNTSSPFEGWQRASIGRSTGRVLPGWISDHSFEQVANGVDHLNALSSIWARGATDVPRRLRDLMLPPARVFCWLLFQRGLWLRGLPGLSLAVIAGYACVATVMKSWERSRSPEQGPPAAP